MNMQISVDSFLECFVAADRHEEARDQMREMFASMAAELGRDMFRNFKGFTVGGSDTGSVSDSDEKPKKKRAPRKKKEEVDNSDRPTCTGLTAAGNPCKNMASAREELCHVHLKKKNDPPKEPKAKKTKEPKAPKAKKVKNTKKVPEHNHELTEEDAPDCDLCESHGNKVVEGFEEEFELDGDSSKVLEAILAKASDSEADSDNDDMQFLEELQEENDDMPDFADSPPRTRSSKSRPMPKSMRAV
jgi:hypothetical protein